MSGSNAFFPPQTELPCSVCPHEVTEILSNIGHDLFIEMWPTQPEPSKTLRLVRRKAVRTPRHIVKIEADDTAEKIGDGGNTFVQFVAFRNL